MMRTRLPGCLRRAHSRRLSNLRKLIVWKDTQNRAAQPCAIDQRGVTEFVEQNDVIFGDQGRNRSERRGIAAAETKRGFGCLSTSLARVPGADAAIAFR